MNPPFSLESGLLLERSSALLLWDSKVETLTTLGSSEIYKHPSTTNISWKDEAVFGGLAVRVDMQGAAGPNAFYLTRLGQADTAQAEYSQLLTELIQRLGQPCSTTTDEGYPWTRWAWGDVVVSLRIAERFVEYVAFMVSKRVVRA